MKRKHWVTFYIVRIYKKTTDPFPPDKYSETLTLSMSFINNGTKSC